MPAVAGDDPRPRWSVMIPSYNGTAFLGEAIGSVLSQDLGRDLMQIEVVDDRTGGDTVERIVADVGGGRVSVYRQPAHAGYVENIATCLRRARGEFVHVLHDDDYVLDGFYRRLGAGLDAAPAAGAAFCRATYLPTDGAPPILSPMERPDAGLVARWLERVASGPRVATPAIVVRRSVYEDLGAFDRRFTCAGEDWEMWVRIAAHYPVWFDPEPLAVYRLRQAGSLTANGRPSGALVRDMRLATSIVASYLPEHLPRPAARKALRSARAQFAFWAVQDGRVQLEAGAWRNAATLASEAVRFRVSRLTVTFLAEVAARAVRGHAGARSRYPPTG